MKLSKLSKSVLTIFISLAMVISGIPLFGVTAHVKAIVAAPSKDKNAPKNYLVLIGRSDGKYTAYDDLVKVASKDKLMVKAKPLASALGITYFNVSMNEREAGKGCILVADNKMNIYYRNKTTYYYVDQSSTKKKVAEYKQCVIDNYNMVHSATLSTLVNYKYYSATKESDYYKLGFAGIIVYDRYRSITSLPSLSNIVNVDLLFKNNPGYYPTIPIEDKNTINVTVQPQTLTDSSYSDIKYIEAVHYTTYHNGKLNLDLTSVQKAFTDYGLIGNGIFGYGTCKNALTIQAYNSNGKLLKETKTAAGGFLIDFPGATKLSISGNIEMLMMDFTPVLPVLLTESKRLSFNQISWLYAKDQLPRQYFIIADNMRFSLENVYYPYGLSRKIISYDTYSDPDRTGAYQRITAVFKMPWFEMYSSDKYLNVSKTNYIIDNSLVNVTGNGNFTLPYNYETELNNMIHAVKSLGRNYLPDKNWNNKLIVKLNTPYTDKKFDFITLDSSTIDLDNFYDYYLHLHEMVHFYEARQYHYGFNIETWTEGNAITLAQKAMEMLGKTYYDSQKNDVIKNMYTTDYSFLTDYDKRNFENYYLNATGWYASVIGYNFTLFLQEYYGSDVVNKIMTKVYAANIPSDKGRKAEYDKAFVNCIKQVTSENVFQLFIYLKVDRNINPY